MATESVCYAECLLPSRHRVHHRRNSQPSRWPACLSTNVFLLLLFREIHRGGAMNEDPHPNLFLSWKDKVPACILHRMWMTQACWLPSGLSRRALLQIQFGE
ncbi:hypothetical protein Q8A73_022491 [Channa argus]|nr:hypothetical protein Q8A73_022491 [Channa argus]